MNIQTYMVSRFNEGVSGVAPLKSRVANKHLKDNLMLAITSYTPCYEKNCTKNKTPGPVYGYVSDFSINFEFNEYLIDVLSCVP